MVPAYSLLDGVDGGAMEDFTTALPPLPAFVWVLCRSLSLGGGGGSSPSCLDPPTSLPTTTIHTYLLSHSPTPTLPPYHLVFSWVHGHCTGDFTFLLAAHKVSMYMGLETDGGMPAQKKLL